MATSRVVSEPLVKTTSVVTLVFASMDSQRTMFQIEKQLNVLILTNVPRTMFAAKIPSVKTAKEVIAATA